MAVQRTPTRRCTRVHDSTEAVYTYTVRVQGRVTEVQTARTRPLHSHVHGPYTCTQACTRPYTGRLHTPIHARERHHVHGVYGPCTQLCTRTVSTPVTKIVYTAAYKPCTRPYTRSCRRPCKGRIRSYVRGRVHVYTARRRPFHGRRIHMYRIVCTAICTGRVHSRYAVLHTDRKRVHNPLRGRIQTVYTVVYTDRVHVRVQDRVHGHVQAVYACTRPCT